MTIILHWWHFSLLFIAAAIYCFLTDDSTPWSPGRGKFCLPLLLLALCAFMGDLL